MDERKLRVYRYLLHKDLIALEEVPEPYQSALETATE